MNNKYFSFSCKLSLLLSLVTLFLSGCMSENPQVIKETDINKKTVLSFFNTAYNLKQPDKASILFAAKSEARSIKGDTLLIGPTEIARSISSFLNNTDNVKFRSEWVYAEGEMVMIRWIISCTPKIDLFGMPAAVPIDIHGASFLKFFDRQIVSSVTYWNYIQK